MFSHFYISLTIHFHFTFPPFVLCSLPRSPVTLNCSFMDGFLTSPSPPLILFFFSPHSTPHALARFLLSGWAMIVWGVLVQLAASSFWIILLGGWSLPQRRVRLCRPDHLPILSVIHQPVSTIVVFVFFDMFVSIIRLMAALLCI